MIRSFKTEFQKIKHRHFFLLLLGCLFLFFIWMAWSLRDMSADQVVVAEKADIKRSGCLAAGVNALNAYISGGHTPQDYVEYARKDAEGIVRDDLLLTIAEKVNVITKGEKGYSPTDVFPQNTSPKEGAAALNAANGVTKAQEAAMVAGSMFGWDTPAANPKNYDALGQPIKNLRRSHAAER